MDVIKIKQAGTQFYQNSSVTYMKTLCRFIAAKIINIG